MEGIIAAAWATVTVLTNVLPSLYIGLFLASFVTHSNLAGKSRRFLPLIARITGLPPVCALSVVLALGDRTAGMAAVAGARTRGGLTDGEVIAANLVAKAPSVVQFFVFSFIPIMLSLYPAAIAIKFLVLYFSAFSVMSIIGILYARLLPFHRRELIAASTATEGGLGWWKSARRAGVESLRPFTGMAGWMAGMSFLAMLFIKSGLLSHVAEVLPVLSRLGVDVAAMPLAGAGLVSMIGGVAAVGVAVQEGALASSSVVPLLLTISILHNCYDLFASSLPRTIGVFGHRLGVKVALVSFAVTQVVMISVLLVAIG